jgi:hypothetical protein
MIKEDSKGRADSDRKKVANGGATARETGGLVGAKDANFRRLAFKE